MWRLILAFGLATAGTAAKADDYCSALTGLAAAAASGGSAHLSGYDCTSRPGLVRCVSRPGATGFVMLMKRTGDCLSDPPLPLQQEAYQGREISVETTPIPGGRVVLKNLDAEREVQEIDVLRSVSESPKTMPAVRTVARRGELEGLVEEVMRNGKDRHQPASFYARLQIDISKATSIRGVGKIDATGQHAVHVVRGPDGDQIFIYRIDPDNKHAVEFLTWTDGRFVRGVRIAAGEYPVTLSAGDPDFVREKRYWLNLLSDDTPAPTPTSGRFEGQLGIYSLAVPAGWRELPGKDFADGTFGYQGDAGKGNFYVGLANPKGDLQADANDADPHPQSRRSIVIDGVPCLAQRNSGSPIHNSIVCHMTVSFRDGPKTLLFFMGGASPTAAAAEQTATFYETANSVRWGSLSRSGRAP